ncbi:MAG TPA: hypothetical protein VGO11_09550 [Chthoniobacteraceae bacterium]|nr:hypothetical protein [Chthoniobacteraceae bacterium]
MCSLGSLLLAVPVFCLTSMAALALDLDRDPAWSEADKAGPLTADETKAFMKQLAQFVFEHHMKKTGGSAQRGMTYEYFHVARAGQVDQFIQGEALDTMHDGSWFAVAMVNAARATGDPLYTEILTRWQLPFYLKMLNHSDELFDSARNDARPDDRTWQGNKEWLLQGREKGFVPYWWDDGGSVSLEMVGRKDKDEHVNFPSHNDLAGRPNPEKRLSGYSLGSSNHLAQDLGVMLQQSWLLLHESIDPGDRKLTAELVEAARNLQECRARHGQAGIPAVRAAQALTSGDAAIRKSLPETTWKTAATARNDYRRALFEFKPDEPVSSPAFADNQAYIYYSGIAREGTFNEPLAFLLTYDAFTLPKLYQLYSDDSPVPPGINVFDLYPYKFVNGKPVDLRSQRKGPSGRPKPIGSRFGPQNMGVCGWALQALKAHPGLWDRAKEQITVPNYFPSATEAEVRAALERELGAGLRTWQAIFQAKGYIPTGLGTGSCGAGFNWDELSDTGGYAHLISAGAQWVNYLEGKRDWELHQLPGGPPR